MSLFDDVDFAEIEQRIASLYSSSEYIEMVKRRGVWQQKKEKRYEGVDWADGSDLSVRTDMLYGAGVLGKSPRFVIVDECGPGATAFTAAEISYETRTGRFEKSPVRRSADDRSAAVVDGDDELESRRRAIRSALVRIPVSKVGL